MSEKPKTQYDVLFILGGPGAGKGTQCIKMAEKYGFKHLSAGDLLREERQRAGSEYGELIQGHIKAGSIVPVEITCSLLNRAMDESGKKCFLIDGFPRNKDNLDGWVNKMSDVASVKRVLFFKCSDETCIKRCLERGQNSGRADDNEESLKKRIVTYRESTMPIIDEYKKRGLVTELNAENNAEKVFEDVMSVIDELKEKDLRL